MGKTKIGKSNALIPTPGLCFKYWDATASECVTCMLRDDCKRLTKTPEKIGWHIKPNGGQDEHSYSQDVS
jgi:hypothetical protein